VNRHDESIGSFCITYDKPIDWGLFVEWIEALISTNGNNLLRLKGLLNIADAEGPVAVHGVQHVFHPPAMLPEWPSEDRTSKIVMITRDMTKEPVEKMMRAFLENSAAS